MRCRNTDDTDNAGEATRRWLRAAAVAGDGSAAGLAWSTSPTASVDVSITLASSDGRGHAAVWATGGLTAHRGAAVRHPPARVYGLDRSNSGGKGCRRARWRANAMNQEWLSRALVCGVKGWGGGSWSGAWTVGLRLSGEERGGLTLVARRSPLTDHHHESPARAESAGSTSPHAPAPKFGGTSANVELLNPISIPSSRSDLTRPDLSPHGNAQKSREPRNGRRRLAEHARPEGGSTRSA